MTAPGSRLLDALRALSAADRDGFGRAFAGRAFDLGLTYLADTGPRPIPVAFPPVAEPRARTRQRAVLARGVVEALAGVAGAVLDGALGAELADGLLAELAPFERELVRTGHRDVDLLATVRVDLFVDPAGRDRVLEVNATIPAMQGYSDIAARAFLEVALERLAARPAAEAASRAGALLARSGSNAADLLASLVACYRARDGAAARPSIALVHRDRDSQLGELVYLARQFAAAGHDARTVVAHDVALDAAGRPTADGFTPDVLYRHVFARRVDPAWPLAAVLREPRRHLLFNPVDPHLEQKGMLAELSAAAADPARAARVGLGDRGAALVREHVPWTRRLVPGATIGPAGASVDELVAWAAAHPSPLVVKRSWDFGGKGVFLGREHGDEGSRRRCGERFGRELAWPELVRACADEGGWVVQGRVELAPRPLWVASTEGVQEAPLFVDVSAYTNLGTAVRPEGGVCRASGSAIVNIQSGGGVVPLLSAEVLDELAATVGV